MDRPPMGSANDSPKDWPGEEQARNRFMIINAVRMSGAAMVLIAMLIIGGKIPAPEFVGYILIAIGLFDVFFVPVFLARKWSTKKR